MGKKKAKYRGQVEVPMTEELDDDTFLRHLELRHSAECGVEESLPRLAVEAWVGTYRAFHERLHRIAVPGQHDHVHVYDDDDEEFLYE